MKIGKNIFISLSIFLMALRSPLIILSMGVYIISTPILIKRVALKIIPFVIFLLFAVLYSIFQGNIVSNIFGQLRDIFLSVIVAVFLICSSEYSSRNNSLIYETIKKMFITIAIIKICILAFSFISGIPMGDIITWIRETWNIQMMSLGVQGTFIARLQIPLDSAVPFFMYFVTKEIIDNKEKKLSIYFVFILLVISMLLTLSRAFWAETIFFISLAIIVEANAIKIFKVCVLGFTSAGVLLTLTPVGDLFFKVIETRFGGQNSSNLASDVERIWQNRMLLNSFWESPILGHGIGYFIPNAIRSEDTPYLYESQSLSMLMTLGVLGVLLLLFLYIKLCFDSIQKDTNGVMKFFIPIVFIFFWIFSGSVNPLLFGASGGLIIFFIAKFHVLSKRTSFY
ncbi:O-antigen ligase family protein [Pectobacterium betavasculorum]|uniref:O-antigen ligase n=1 Tax=Pectobacterium betavasculorum TaxID=55207 RepID=A0ABR4V1H4_9GAMM|nr:O-antigen ligase family protein [Pectobacterium betavasculorum]KFX21081.1 O-antigen ligase [Pectobacterium betavasculorum]